MQRDGRGAIIREKFAALKGLLDERSRRRWAATEAKAMGYSGQTIVANATGISRTTIDTELRELAQAADVGVDANTRVRSPGGGRKPLTDDDPTVLADPEGMVEPMSRGDPESPLRWTCKRTRQLANALQRQGHTVGRQTVADLLADLGYSLQGNRKSKEGTAHPDRDAQFQSINAQVTAFQARRQPVVSVDTKKKELVGDFKNGGREWRPQGEPELIRTDDFVDKKLGKVIRMACTIRQPMSDG
jgi:hypothetical protein